MDGRVVSRRVFSSPYASSWQACWPRFPCSFADPFEERIRREKADRWELPEAGAGSCEYHASREEKLVDAEKPKQVFEFYMFVWKIFYLCYLLLPLAA